MLQKKNISNNNCKGLNKLTNNFFQDLQKLFEKFKNKIDEDCNKINESCNKIIKSCDEIINFPNE